MPSAGTFPSVDSPEIVQLSIDFSSLLAVGDSISACAGSLAVSYGLDPNVEGLLQTVAAFNGTVVTQWVGGAWVAGVIYRWFAVVATTNGASFQAYGEIACQGSWAAPVYPIVPTLPGALTTAELMLLAAALAPYLPVDLVNPIFAALPREAINGVPAPGLPFVNLSDYVVISQ